MLKRLGMCYIPIDREYKVCISNAEKYHRSGKDKEFYHFGEPKFHQGLAYLTSELSFYSGCPRPDPGLSDFFKIGLEIEPYLEQVGASGYWIAPSVKALCRYFVAVCEGIPEEKWIELGGSIR